METRQQARQQEDAAHQERMTEGDRRERKIVLSLLTLSLIVIFDSRHLLRPPHALPLLEDAGRSAA